MLTTVAKIIVSIEGFYARKRREQQIEVIFSRKSC